MPPLNASRTHHCYCGSSKRPFCQKHRVYCAKHSITFYKNEECSRCRASRQAQEARKKEEKHHKQQKLDEENKEQAEARSYGLSKKKLGGNKKAQ